MVPVLKQVHPVIILSSIRLLLMAAAAVEHITESPQLLVV